MQSILVFAEYRFIYVQKQEKRPEKSGRFFSFGQQAWCLENELIGIC